MKEKDMEKLLELLSDKALASLEDDELKELQGLEKEFPEAIKMRESFELAAAAVQLADLDMSEPLPLHLKERILKDAEKLFESSEIRLESSETRRPVEVTSTESRDRVPFFAWLGWAVAGAACVALAINIYLTRLRETTTTTQTTVEVQQKQPTLAEEREKLLAFPDTIKLEWHDPKNPKEIIGDLVWSNSTQKGFVRFYKLPANDPNKETYQLWIVDESQKYPIDGGLFNVSSQGEVILPIDARLKVEKPKMFAVTAEKPGGVVVSDLKRLMAVAKVET